MERKGGLGQMTHYARAIMLAGGLLIAPAAGWAADVCSASAQRVDAIDPHIKGAIAALQTKGHPKDMTGLAFKREDGSAVSIADFKGKTLLFNLWATWCAPCRHEMPDLDKLQADLGGDDFEVVTVSLDRKAPGKARDFFDEIKLKDLELYYDSSMKLFPALRKQGLAFGMPTTLIIDEDGCSIAHMAGPAAWADDQANTMIKGSSWVPLKRVAFNLRIYRQKSPTHRVGRNHQEWYKAFQALMSRALPMPSGAELSFCRPCWTSLSNTPVMALSDL